jgi:hypothetical protein
MSRRTAAWLAWSAWVLTLALLALSILLILFIPSVSILGLQNPIVAVVFIALILSFSTIGVLISTRQPQNLIGRIMLVAGFTLATTFLTGNYVDLSLAQPQGRLPGTQWAAWVSEWVWVPGIVPALTFLLLVFPNGRLLSRRWRLVGWLAVAAIVTLALGSAFTPGPFLDYPRITNPLGLTRYGGSLLVSLLEDGGVGWLLLPASVVLCASSMVVRYRRAAGEERQQIKWLALAAAFAAVCWVTLTLTYETELGGAAQLLGLLSFLGIPLAVGIAVLKYRLYDIDLLINRTLVYGILTAMLALVYFGGVTATQAIFRALTSQEQQPQLAIVVSTLLIAALFNPLRERIQSFIDRRFYRSKYDAAKTLEAFSAKLRDETDLDALNADLVGVVRETMQPAHVSLWLRPDTASKGKEAD